MNSNHASVEKDYESSEFVNNSKKKSYNHSDRASDNSKSNARFKSNFFRGRGRGRFVTQDNNNLMTKSQIQKKANKDAIYGNYAYYYGYRNQFTPDERLTCLKRDWIENKDVLDIGCNTGQFTLSIAKNLSPRMIIGLDIDASLIRAAKKNTKHYLTEDIEYDADFPISCIFQFGPVALAASRKKYNCSTKFPFNVSFVQGNYVFDSNLLEVEEPKFDVILCLSVTKWIQLNWGDDGLMLAFRRMFSQLRSGGYLILEPQPLKSYAKSKKLSDTHWKNFAEMKFPPDQYKNYLLDIVGFKSCDLINNVKDQLSEVQGFQRPLYLFTKGIDPNHVIPKHTVFHSDESSDSSNYSDMDVEELSD